MAEAAWSALASRLKRVALWRWKPARSSYGTPSSSQITSEGTGSAKSATRSAGAPRRAIAVRWRSTMAVMRGSRERVRWAVKAPARRRRSRVCCGASMSTSQPGSAGAP